jgi:hypothetical protein
VIINGELLFNTQINENGFGGVNKYKSQKHLNSATGIASGNNRNSPAI